MTTEANNATQEFGLMQAWRTLRWTSAAVFMGLLDGTPVRSISEHTTLANGTQCHALRCLDGSWDILICDKEVVGSPFSNATPPLLLQN
jgi:hypothetical protein